MKTTSLQVPINFEVYVVKEGDTLINIWRNNIVCLPFSKASQMICHENQLESEEDLNPGQNFKIPVADSKNFIKYRVKEGDTLCLIARKYNNSSNVSVEQFVENIEKINGKDNVSSIELE